MSKEVSTWEKMEYALVYQPMFLFDNKRTLTTEEEKRFGEFNSTALTINRVINFASMIPILSLITACIRGYQLYKVGQMDPRQFRGHEADQKRMQHLLIGRIFLEVFQSVFAVFFIPLAFNLIMNGGVWAVRKATVTYECQPTRTVEERVELHLEKPKENFHTVVVA